MLKSLFLSLLLMLPVPALACGGAEACEVEGGVYHIALPDGPIRGAVVFLHGYGGRGERVVANKGLMRQFTERGYALIAPTALPRVPGSPNSWNSQMQVSRRDDIAFIRVALADATARFGLPAGAMVSGFSGGGMMVWRLACSAPDSFAAYAPIAGLMWRPLPATCDGPVQLFHVHGWSDPVVPIEGRSVAGGRITQGDLFVGLNLLRDASACIKDDPDSYDVQGMYLIRRWTSCAPGGDLSFALHPGGHAIPKGWAGLALNWLEALPGPASPAPAKAEACLQENAAVDTC
ncbi:MAG: polyhydroxybutyrate depolymerase [Pseudomonadota bacterium]